MAIAKVGPRHQVVIPKDVFEKMRLAAGDYVDISFRKNHARIEPRKIVPRDEDEPIGPKTRAALRRALREVRSGKKSTPLRTIEEVQAELDALKRRK